MKFALGLTVLALAASAANAIRSDHPIIGTWTHTLPNGCSEIYTYRADGTTSVTSGEEVGSSVYEISDKPGASGFYTLVDTITEQNGKKDCMGGVVPVGDKATVFVQFNPRHDQMLVCYKESLTSCFGPLTRVPPT